MTLACKGLHVAFGKSRILNGVSLALQPGLNVLIGANGSGKTTLLRALAGFLRPSRGEITMGADALTNLSPDQRRRLGLIYRPQSPLITPQISARDYLALAFAGQSAEEAFKRAVELGFPRALGERVMAARLVNEMPLGERRALELMTAAVEARAILLDEPLANVGGEALEVLGSFFEGVASRTPLLLVEHRREFFAWVRKRRVVGSFMQAGEVVLREVDASALLAHEGVLKAYGSAVQ